MKLIPFLTVCLLAAISPLGAETIPYTNDFSGIGDNTAFTTESPGTEWAVTSGVYQYSVPSTSNTNIPSIASIPITDAAGVPFTLQTQFTVSSVGTVNAANTLGFGLFGSDAVFTGTGAPYYLADFTYASNGTAGLLRILSLGDTAGFTTISTGTADDDPGTGLAIALDTTYTLRLQATYAGSTLNMTLGLFDAAGTAQIGTSASVSDTSPLTGTNFGYRNRHAKGGGTIGIDFDNYSIVPVPEPAAYAVLGIGMLAFALLRRRRTVHP